MKYKYVVRESDPYRSDVENSESGEVVYAFTGDLILKLMGKQTVLNAVYEILIRDGLMKPGDILAPERL